MPRPPGGPRSDGGVDRLRRARVTGTGRATRAVASRAVLALACATPVLASAAPVAARSAPRAAFVRTLPVDSGRVDVAAHVLPVAGGALIAGWTALGDEPPDALLLRVGEDGDVVWHREIGGAGADLAFTIQPAAPGEYVCAGFTTSRGAGASDGWIFAVDPGGDTLWQRVFGGGGDERLTSLRATRDGWIAAGQTASGGAMRAWVLCTDSAGRQRSSFTWGGAAHERALGVEPLEDGGCVIVGRIGEGRDEVDGFVTRLDPDGREAWTQRVGGKGFQVAYHLRRHTDGSLFVTGYGHEDERRDSDGYLLRVAGDGRVLYRRSLGGTTADRAVQSFVFDDGSAIVAGYSRPRDRADGEPAWTLRLYGLDPRGEVRWQNALSGPGRESGRWIAGSAGDLWVVGQSVTPRAGSAVLVARLRAPD